MIKSQNWVHQQYSQNVNWSAPKSCSANYEVCCSISNKPVQLQMSEWSDPSSKPVWWGTQWRQTWWCGGFRIILYSTNSVNFHTIDVSEETSKRWMDHQEAENHRSCEVTRSRLFDLLQVLVAYAPNWDTLLAKRPNLYLIANPSERSRGIRVCQGSCFKVLEGKNQSWWVLEAGQSGALLKSWVLEGNFFMHGWPIGDSETQWAGRRWAMGR